VKYQFIAAYQQEFQIMLMCRVLGVSRSGYYAWRKRPPRPRKMADQQLTEQIEVIHRQSRRTYGPVRVQVELADQGIRCGHNRVARLMREAGLSAKQSRKFKLRTTDSNHDEPIAPHLLQRDFTASRPNQKWLGDITFIPTAAGWLYLAVILDLYSRRIVGWAMGDSLDRSLVLRALRMALETRQPEPGLLHHSDRGSQYASQDYRALLTKYQIQASMSRKGNCYDNAPVESFFANLKTELIHQRRYLTRQEAQTDIFEYIEVFYNRYRRHSALGYLSPVAFEELPLPT
jgi:transposase InsO family protein